MEVYIEYVILDNLIINNILLYFTSYTLKLNAKKRLCFLSSLFGTVGAIVFPFITLFKTNYQLNNFLMFCLKLLLGFVMVLIIKKQKSVKQYFVTYFLFITYTFLLGGVCFGFLYLLNLQTTFSGVLLFGFEIPVGLFVLLAVCYLKILFLLVKNVKHKTTFHNFYYDVKLKSNNKSVQITGFLDSGNQVQICNGGIVIIGYKTLSKLYPNLNYQNIIIGDLKNCGLKNAEFINVTNSGGITKMLTFTIDELQVVTNQEQIVTLKEYKVGLAKTNFNGRYDCLLNAELFV